MLIDCDTCAVRGSGCADCVVTMLLSQPAPGHLAEFDDAEIQAVGALAEGGLVSPLRLVPLLGKQATPPGRRRSA